MTQTSPDTTWDAARWLLCRTDLPYRARDTWARGASAGIRVSEHFDALYLPAPLVERALVIRDRDAVEAHLRDAGLTHGVIVPRTRLDYVLLVPPGTSATWAEPRTECRGRGYPSHYVTAPPPTRREPPGAYWILPPPTDRAQLCPPELVRDLLTHRRPQ
ncbi:hypothetical protein ACFQ2B_03705 [Streptomyces stramineus]|uniref:DNA primase/polymerase bifunctional N-terminal domain-containing protein n=1 Tax=Streptomyces stramineus TaxID=173861 RepID=A0ABP3K6I8_9ACTN